jgi:hypothetical protein
VIMRQMVIMVALILLIKNVCPLQTSVKLELVPEMGAKQVFVILQIRLV